MPLHNIRRKSSRQRKLTDISDIAHPKKILRPGAPHNTTQYLSKNLVFYANAICEDDITEIRGTMEGVFVISDQETDLYIRQTLMQ